MRGAHKADYQHSEELTVTPSHMFFQVDDIATHDDEGQMMVPLSFESHGPCEVVAKYDAPVGYSTKGGDYRYDAYTRKGRYMGGYAPKRGFRDDEDLEMEGYYEEGMGTYRGKGCGCGYKGKGGSTTYTLVHNPYDNKGGYRNKGALGGLVAGGLIGGAVGYAAGRGSRD